MHSTDQHWQGIGAHGLGEALVSCGEAMLSSEPQWLGRAVQSGGEAMTRNALAWLGDAEAWLRIAQQRDRIGIAWACEGKALDSDDQRGPSADTSGNGVALGGHARA